MKVHAEHKRIKEYLLEHPKTNIQVVDIEKDAEYLVTGRYTHDKYNDRLKGIVIPWTGHNGIDLHDMRKDGLNLYIVPTRSRWVAEKAITLALALLGNTIIYHEGLKTGNWNARNGSKRRYWISIQDSKVGLFGYGRIGKYIHHFLQGFGSDVYTIDRDKVYPKSIKLVKDLDRLIDTCDVIIISTPLNKTTEGVFDETLLSHMEDKYIINIGRGKILNEEALYNALKNKTLAGFASDVWYTYPKGKELQVPSNYPIYDLDNVVLSNHSGGYTKNTNEEVDKDLLELLEKIADGNFSDALNLDTLI